MYHIQTSGFYINEDIEELSFFGQETFLDSDLLLINPAEITSYLLQRIYHGNDKVNYLNVGANSKAIYSHIIWRQNEIKTLLERGKIVTVFLTARYECEFERIKKDSNYSSVSNYEFLPILMDFMINFLQEGKVNKGNFIKLIEPKNPFANFYNAFKNELIYETYLDYKKDDSNINYFLVNKSDKPIGFTFKYQEGLLAFLPFLGYGKDDMKLIGVLTDACKIHFKAAKKTNLPNWCESYILSGEQQLINEIKNLESQKDNLENDIKTNQILLEELGGYKRLLYEQGKELEDATIKTFILLGFKAENRKENDLEHDIIFSSNEGKGVAEVEGKDNDAIHIAKLDQLNRAIDEDFHLTNEYPSGILIGNHYRLSQPEKRKEAFTEKVKIVAQKKSYGLLTTFELYKAVEYVLKNPNDESFKKDCREKILTTSGTYIKLL